MSKKQKEEMEYIRIERVVVEQGKQLSECWKFLSDLMCDDELLPRIDHDISRFLTNQPFYDMEGRHGAKTEGKATPTTGD
tara:strand:+ start:169 stop:408 length:240 start_codon:yes stop_codon:yes gene_type:complete